jgi:hypothetical protein
LGSSHNAAAAEYHGVHIDIDLRGGLLEVFKGDGAVGEEEVAGGEAGERRAAEVHDHFHQRGELRVVLHPAPKLAREQLQEPSQLIFEPLRYGGLALRGAQGSAASAAAAEGERANGGWAGCRRGESTRGRETGRVEREQGQPEAEVDQRRRRRRHRGGREHEWRERASDE